MEHTDPSLVNSPNYLFLSIIKYFKLNYTHEGFID